MNGYLKRILNARVYDVAIESPLELAPNLSARIGNRAMARSNRRNGAANQTGGLISQGLYLLIEIAVNPN